MRVVKATLDEIRKALQTSSGKEAIPKPEANVEYIVRELSDYRDAVAGGKAALHFLKQKAGEDADMWGNRYEAFENINTCKTAIEDWTSWLYGSPPDRDFWIKDRKKEPVSDELDRLVKQVYDDNDHESLFYREVAMNWFVDKWTAVKVWRSDAISASADEDRKVILSHLARENVRMVYHPMDRKTLLGIIEMRQVGRDWVRWLWTRDEVGLIDGQWEWLPSHELFPDYFGPDKNPVSPLLPIVIFGDPGSHHPLADTLLHQRGAINRRSIQTLALRLQAFSKLVVEGELLDAETPTPGDGEPRVVSSPSMYHQVSDGGKIYYVSADFPFDKFQACDEAWIQAANEEANVSPFARDSTKAPEQPLSMAIKMTKPMNQRFAHMALARPAELQVADLILAWLKDSGEISSDLKIDREITFPRNPLPTDRNAERLSDQLDVSEFRLPLKDYIKKYHLPNADEKELEEYIAELKREAQANQTSLVQQFLNSRNGNGNGNGAGGKPESRAFSGDSSPVPAGSASSSAIKTRLG